MSLYEYSTTYVPKYAEPVQIAQEHEAAHWMESEVKLQTDVEQFKTNVLSQQNKEFVNQILRVFTQSDVNVGASYYDNLIPVIKNNEVRNMLGSFASREGIHQRGYALYSDTLGYGEAFHAEFKAQPSMLALLQYVEQPGLGMFRSVFRQVMMEGVALFAMFSALMQFDLKGQMPGMADLVRWSVRDESLHVRGLAWLFRTAWSEARNKNELDAVLKPELYNDARLAYALIGDLMEDVFSTNGSPVITEEQMHRYIGYVLNYRLQQLGMKPITAWNDDPIPEVTALFGRVFGNFFEREITEYSKDNLSGEFSDAVYRRYE